MGSMKPLSKKLCIKYIIFSSIVLILLWFFNFLECLYHHLDKIHVSDIITIKSFFVALLSSLFIYLLSHENN